MSLAVAKSTFDYALDYVQERKQIGKPIIDFQAVQLKLAEMKMKIDASRMLLYRAVVNGQRGLPSIADSSIAKYFANVMVREVTGIGMQLFGVYGYSKGYPIEQKMCDAWGWGIAGGTIDTKNKYRISFNWKTLRSEKIRRHQIKKSSLFGNQYGEI